MMLHLFITVQLLTFLLTTEHASSTRTIRIHPLKLCQDSIELSLSLERLPVPTLLHCDEMLFPLFSKFGAVTRIFITGQNRTIWLRNLNKNTTYIFQVTCESESDVAYASDRELLTTTLDECETVPLATDVMMPSDVSSSSSVQLSKASGSMTASTTEVVYTISLSFVGVTVILVPLYYIWKRHRRRQRIRRIFRNDNTDPFENLHDHMEVDDSPTAV